MKLVYLCRLLLLARLLAPEDFGLLAMSVVVLDVLTRLTDAGVSAALIQARDTRRQDYDVAWTVGLIRGFVVAAIIGAAAPLFASLFGEPRAASLMRLLAAAVLIESTISIRTIDLHRNLQFRPLAVMYLGEAVVNASVAIALAPTIGVWALGAGPIAGVTVQSVLSYVVAPYRPRFAMDLQIVRRLLVYGRWIFLTGLVAVLGGSLLQLVITRQLGSAELGLYFLAARLAFLPSTLSSEVAGVVAFPLFARLQHDREQVRQAIRSGLVSLAAIIGPASLVLMSIAPALVDHVLGTRWSGAEALIVILASVNIIGLAGDLMMPALRGLGHPSAAVVTGTLQYSLLVGLGWLFTSSVGVWGAALAWLPAVAVTQLVAFGLLSRHVSRPFASTARPLTAIFVVSAIAAALSALTVLALPMLGGVIAALVIGGVITVGGLWLVDRRSGLNLESQLRAAFPRIDALARIGSGA